MTATFEAVASQLANELAADYAVAVAAARQHNGNKAGHAGEASWKGLLEKWFPRHKIVTRKYIVGPGGSSNEVDLLVLKLDYPPHLAEKHEILISGVAAAFSCKTTLRVQHIAEAIAQKRTILKVAGYDFHLDGVDGLDPATDPYDDILRQQPSTLHGALRGPFPFGLLAHSSVLSTGGGDFRTALSGHYRDAAYAGTPPAVNHPLKELDAVLVANAGFFRTLRVSFVPNSEELAPGGPTSTFAQDGNALGLEGAELIQFLLWVSSVISRDEVHALKTMEPLLAPRNGFGYFAPWPLTVYPEHLRSDLSNLLQANGEPYLFWN